MDANVSSLRNQQSTVLFTLMQLCQNYRLDSARTCLGAYNYEKFSTSFLDRYMELFSEYFILQQSLDEENHASITYDDENTCLDYFYYFILTNNIYLMNGYLEQYTPFDKSMLNDSLLTYYILCYAIVMQLHSHDIVDFQQDLNARSGFFALLQNSSNVIKKMSEFGNQYYYSDV